MSCHRRIIFLGDGVPVFREALTERILAGKDVAFAPCHMNRQRAASVAALGIRYYQSGRTETAAQHRPEYLRISQAERERKEREQKARELAQTEREAHEPAQA